MSSSSKESCSWRALCADPRTWPPEAQVDHRGINRRCMQRSSHSLAHAASGVVRHWPAGQGSGAARRRVGMGVKPGGHDKHTRLAIKASGRAWQLGEHVAARLSTVQQRAAC